MGFPNASLVGRSELKGGLLGREGRLETVIVEKRTYTHTVEDFDKEFLHRVRTVIDLKLEGYSDFRHLLFGLSEESVKVLNQGLNSGEPMCFSGSRKKER